LLVVSAALSQVKSPYPHSAVNPNQITQSLIAVLAGLRVPFVCTETHEMGEEILASYLYQVHLFYAESILVQGTFEGTPPGTKK
jgi:hypothetical protein